MSKMTRRDILRRGLQYSVGGAVVLALDGCGGAEKDQFACIDPADMSEGERSMRVSLAYTDNSAVAQQVCGGCAFYTEAVADGGCGSCELLGGQVSTKGRCESWSARS